MKLKLFFISAAFTLSQSSFASYDMYSVNVPDEAKPQMDKKQILLELKQKKGYIDKISAKCEYLNNIEIEQNLHQKAI